jgi:hypothetical protein
MSEGIDLSYIKLETTAKGLVQPTVSVKVGTTDEEMDKVRVIAIQQLQKTIDEVKALKMNVVGEA